MLSFLITKKPNAKSYIMMFDETPYQPQNSLKTPEQYAYFLFKLCRTD